MRLASIHALSLIGATLGSPALLLARDDWKDALGWDGKTTTPAQLDPSNVVKPVPGVPAPAALSGGVYFCTDAGFKGSCLYVAKFNSGQCVNFGNEFNDKVTSFGPDPGLACLLWSAWNCQGSNPGGYLVNPGKLRQAIFTLSLTLYPNRVQQPGTVQLQRRSQLVRVQSRVIDELTMN